jgi:hypothetical protein
VWAASAAFTQFVPSDFDDDEDAETALGWLTRDWLRRFTQAFGRWLDVAPSWPPRWRDAAGMNDTFVVVTAAQLQEMTAEIGCRRPPLRARRAGRSRSRPGRGLCHLLPGRHGPGAATMTRRLTREQAYRVFVLLTVTRWLPVGLVVGIVILLQTDRGLSIAEALTAAAISGYVCFTLELPTSGFADAFGRRPSISRRRGSTWSSASRTSSPTRSGSSRRRPP